MCFKIYANLDDLYTSFGKALLPSPTEFDSETLGSICPSRGYLDEVSWRKPGPFMGGGKTRKPSAVMSFLSSTNV